VGAFLIVREIDFGCELLCLLGENLFAFASYAPTHSLSWQKGKPWNQNIVLFFLVFFYHETLTPIRGMSSQNSIYQFLSSVGVYTLIINVAVNLKFVSRLLLMYGTAELYSS